MNKILSECFVLIVWDYLFDNLANWLSSRGLLFSIIFLSRSEKFVSDPSLYSCNFFIDWIMSSSSLHLSHFLYLLFLNSFSCVLLLIFIKFDKYLYANTINKTLIHFWTLAWILIMIEIQFVSFFSEISLCKLRDG